MAKVIFVQDIAYEYFGVMYISSYIQSKGHSCDVLIEALEPQLFEKLAEAKPDLIGFSTLTGSFKWSINMARKIKENMDVPIIFGGVHVYTNPQKTIEFDAVDMICTGEGEIAMGRLCDSLDAGQIDTSIEGLWFKEKDGSIKRTDKAKLIDPLDELPFPDRQMYWKYPSIESRTTFPLMGSRGCPYTCSYCFIPTAKEIFKGQGNFVRQRSAENILAEVAQCLEWSPVKTQVQFVEDHFGNNRTRTRKILRGISALKNGTLKWAGAIRIERFMKEEYVADLANTNHGLLGLAVECGNEEYRNTVMKRETKNEDIILAADLARKYGIKYLTLNMIGLPGETYEMALETLELNLRIKPYYANCFVYQPYPNTELQQYAVEHKFFTESVSEELGVSFYDRYDEDNKDLQKRINLQRVFSLIVSFPWMKKPLLKLVDWNARFALEALFGVYYLYYLNKYINLTWKQVYQVLRVWSKNKFSTQNTPANVSVTEGKAQFYPSKTESAV